MTRQEQQRRLRIEQLRRYLANTGGQPAARVAARRRELDLLVAGASRREARQAQVALTPDGAPTRQQVAVAKRVVSRQVVAKSEKRNPVQVKVEEREQRRAMLQPEPEPALELPEGSLSRELVVGVLVAVVVAVVVGAMR